MEYLTPIEKKIRLKDIKISWGSWTIFELLSEHISKIR